MCYTDGMPSTERHSYVQSEWTTRMFEIFVNENHHPPEGTWI